MAKSLKFHSSKTAPLLLEIKNCNQELQPKIFSVWQLKKMMMIEYRSWKEINLKTTKHSILHSLVEMEKLKQIKMHLWLTLSSCWRRNRNLRKHRFHLPIIILKTQFLLTISMLWLWNIFSSTMTKMKQMTQNMFNLRKRALTRLKYWI